MGNLEKEGEYKRGPGTRSEPQSTGTNQFDYFDLLYHVFPTLQLGRSLRFVAPGNRTEAITVSLALFVVIRIV